MITNEPVVAVVGVVVSVLTVLTVGVVNGVDLFSSEMNSVCISEQ